MKRARSTPERDAPNPPRAPPDRIRPLLHMIAARASFSERPGSRSSQRDGHLRGPNSACSASLRPDGIPGQQQRTGAPAIGDGRFEIAAPPPAPQPRGLRQPSPALDCWTAHLERTHGGSASSSHAGGAAGSSSIRCPGAQASAPAANFGHGHSTSAPPVHLLHRMKLQTGSDHARSLSNYPPPKDNALRVVQSQSPRASSLPLALGAGPPRPGMDRLGIRPPYRPWISICPLPRTHLPPKPPL